MLIIRNEKESDHRIVEELTRKAFYNLYIPGCVEHYLVHHMRGHEDFIPELDFVAELDGQIIGNIMYTKAKLTDEQGVKKDILTFGPVCIAPEHQRKGFGKALMVKELKEGVLDGRRWFYTYSPVMDLDAQEVQNYDSALEPLEKKYLPSQDEFYIMSHSFVEDEE